MFSAVLTLVAILISPMALPFIAFDKLVAPLPEQPGDVLAQTVSSSPTPTNSPTPTPTLTPTPTPIPTATPTPTPLPPSPTPTAIPTPTPTPVPATPTATPEPQVLSATTAPLSVEDLFTKYADEYKVDRELLKKIAVCESGLNAKISTGYYFGLYQFSQASWANVRAEMGLNQNLDLVFDPEEAIKTAAFMLGKGRSAAWSACN